MSESHQCAVLPTNLRKPRRFVHEEPGGQRALTEQMLRYQA
jgi:hypothetical protein